MKIEYSPDTDSLHVKFSEGAAVKTIRLSDGIFVRLNEADSLVGIDISNFTSRGDLQEFKQRLHISDYEPGTDMALQSRALCEPSSRYAAGNGLTNQPRIIMICGPNGAGKSTSAPELLQGGMGVDEFINADVIAHGLSAFRPEKAAIKAGRVMLSRLNELASQKLNFAFETTLAARSFVPWLTELKSVGYYFSLCFFWLESPELAVDRVAERVADGGHNIPKDVIMRRYEAGLFNFFRFYMPLADHWRFYDNSCAFSPVLIASGECAFQETVLKPEIWKFLKEKYSCV